MISVVMDTAQFVASLKKLKADGQKAIGFSTLQIGHEILRLSELEVPHDIGTLSNSGDVVEQDGDILIGYHTPYAARLHEHPDYNFQKGRKGKYLSDPIVRNQSILGLKLAKDFGKRLGLS